MTELVRFVFSAGGLLVFVLIGVLLIYARPNARFGRRFLLSVAVFYTFATMSLTSFAASRLLIVGFRPLTAADVPPGRTAIVVLGSGSYTIRDWSDTDYSTADVIAASRVLEAVRVYELVNPEWVISAGGKIRPDDVAQATGIAMRNLLVQLGVPADRVVTETTSRNTHEDALAVVSMLPKLNVEHLVLVTSDTHMRRSLGTFRAAGVQTIPAIVRDPFPPSSWPDWIVPGEEGLWGSSLVAHEILGIGYYAARGWYRF